MIAFDVDGVVLDLESRILDVAEDVLGHRPVHRNRRYDFESRFGLSPHTVTQIWTRFQQHRMWADLRPFPGAIEAIREVQEAGIPVAFVTGIAPEAHALRERNLQQLGLRDFQLHCTGSPFASKRHVLQTLAPYAFIDDRLRHLHDAIGVVDHLAWIDLNDEQDIAPNNFNRLNHHPSLAQWLNTHHQWLQQTGTRCRPDLPCSQHALNQ